MGKHTGSKLSIAALLLTISSLGFAQSSAPDAQKILDRSINAAINVIKTASRFELAKEGHSQLHELFELYKKTPLMRQASLCVSLNALNISDLTFLEESLEENKGNPDLKDCESILQAKLEAHWTMQTESLPNQGGLFTPVDEDVQVPFVVNEVNLTSLVPGPYSTKQYKDKEITLTFDDGPRASTTPSILDTLAKWQARAMFFNLGNNSAANPSLTRRVMDEGHTLASHSYDHPDLGKLQRTNGLQAALDNITKGHLDVFQSAGLMPPFFRFPYGSDSPEQLKFLSQEKVFSFRWNMDSMDWQTPDVNKLIAQTEALIAQNKHGIVLMHDIQHQTTLALPYILQYLHDQGYTLILPIFTDEDRMASEVPFLHLQPEDQQEKILQNAAQSIKKHQGHLSSVIPTAAIAPAQQ